MSMLTCAYGHRPDMQTQNLGLWPIHNGQEGNINEIFLVKSCVCSIAFSYGSGGLGGLVWNNLHQLHFVGENKKKGKTWIIRDILSEILLCGIFEMKIHSGFVLGWLACGSTITELRPGLILPGVQLELGSPQSWRGTCEEGLNFQVKLNSQTDQRRCFGSGYH